MLVARSCRSRGSWRSATVTEPAGISSLATIFGEKWVEGGRMGNEKEGKQAPQVNSHGRNATGLISVRTKILFQQTIRNVTDLNRKLFGKERRVEMWLRFHPNFFVKVTLPRHFSKFGVKPCADGAIICMFSGLLQRERDRRGAAKPRGVNVPLPHPCPHLCLNNEGSTSSLRPEGRKEGTSYHGEPMRRPTDKTHLTHLAHLELLASWTTSFDRDPCTSVKL